MRRLLRLAFFLALGPLALAMAAAAQDGSSAEDDPRALYLASIDRWIATHRSLKPLPRERLEDWAPAVIDVHVPPESEPGYAQAVGALVLNSDMLMTFDDFEIEGRPAAVSIDAARRAWAKAQLETLGIPLER